MEIRMRTRCMNQQEIQMLSKYLVTLKRVGLIVLKVLQWQFTRNQMASWFSRQSPGSLILFWKLTRKYRANLNQLTQLKNHCEQNSSPCWFQILKKNWLTFQPYVCFSLLNKSGKYKYQQLLDYLPNSSLPSRFILKKRTSIFIQNEEFCHSFCSSGLAGYLRRIRRRTEERLGSYTRENAR